MSNLFHDRAFGIAAGLLFAVALLFSGLASAERTPKKSPMPLPADITPRVNERQCGSFGDHFGPLDYRSAHPDDKRLVEKFHFDNEYAAFLKGKTTANTLGSSNIQVAGGFAYVLKAFPNHPTALFAIERLGRMLNSEKLEGTEYPLECWYVRAFKITPDDPVVRAMYGIYLANRGRSAEALSNLKIADAGLLSDANMQYNIGLTYFKLGKYEQAQINAMRAAKAGFQLDGLEHMLKKANRWNPNLQLPAAAAPLLPVVEPEPESDVAPK